MSKSIPWYLGISGKNPALGPPKSALGPATHGPWADFFQNPSDRGWIFYQNQLHFLIKS